jgi:hypothetical protein
MADRKSTMQVAKAAQDNSPSEIVKASELIEVRPAKSAALSLAARRALNLMVQAAAGDAWQGHKHVISKKALRGDHKGNERIRDTLEELMTTLVVMRYTSPRGKPATLRATILSVTTEEDDETGNVYFQFTDPIRWLFQQSSTYAVLDARAIRAFESKYAMALYEIGCQLFRRRNPTVRYSMADLREVLNVPQGTYKDFAQLRRKVIEPARREIEALADFQMTVELEKQGRRVVGVRLGFWEKDDHGKDVAAELARKPREQRRATVNASSKAAPRPATQQDLLAALDQGDLPAAVADDEVPL